MGAILAQVSSSIAALIAAVAAISVAYFARRQIRVEADRAHRREVEGRAAQFEHERQTRLYEARSSAYAKLLAALHDTQEALIRYQQAPTDEARTACDSTLIALGLVRAEVRLIAKPETDAKANEVCRSLTAAVAHALSGGRRPSGLDRDLKPLLDSMRADLGSDGDLPEQRRPH
ncbi:hypothetical protein [Nonomuraea cavernae]|uniref:Uncharacterized protein n=1 Tax=Nonomuraea cavernae TaxID=2045107 RepID=A0A918DK10_9ACTN|nr:hypothetical protein [Nonomuraea cavernae]MCA2185887.1 hypothetical protein [Nonomuraea cavernae]GGO69317.1 hypothetical protein GCM10012289_30140 [Nonomuraea cavernae]